MSEVEKPKEPIKVNPPEQVKEPSAPKTAQSAFDKILEQQKLIQQSPVAQGKLTDQGSSDQKVKEIAKWQDRSDEGKKRDEKDDAGGKDKTKQREKGSMTVTRQAITRGGEKSGYGGAGGGKGRGGGGFTSDMAKKQILSKKLSDSRGLLNAMGQASFSSKLAQAKAANVSMSAQQMQAIVNKIIQSIQVGKNELGFDELRLILKESAFAGLRLRLTSKNGKVSVQFETSNKDVKGLFTKEAGKIKAALEERGIAVEDVKVG